MIRGEHTKAFAIFLLQGRNLQSDEIFSSTWRATCTASLLELVILLVMLMHKSVMTQRVISIESAMIDGKNPRVNQLLHSSQIKCITIMLT